VSKRENADTSELGPAVPLYCNYVDRVQRVTTTPHRYHESQKSKITLYINTYITNVLYMRSVRRSTLRGGSVLLPVSCLMRSLSSEREKLSTNQISSMHLSPSLKCNYFWFLRTNVRHIGILLPFAILTRLQKFAFYSESCFQISSKSGHPRQNNDVI